MHNLIALKFSSSIIQGWYSQQHFPIIIHDGSIPYDIQYNIYCLVYYWISKFCNPNLPASFKFWCVGVEPILSCCKGFIFTNFPTTSFHRISCTAFPWIWCYNFAQFLFTFFTHHYFRQSVFWTTIIIIILHTPLSPKVKNLGEKQTNKAYFVCHQNCLKFVLYN